MQANYYFKRTWVAGETVEICKTYSAVKGGGRKKRENTTSEAVAKYNLKMAHRKLTRLINANFKPGDLFLNPTYRDSMTVEEAKKHIDKFLRDLRRYFKKQGRELKYILVTAYGERGRIHHHLVINTADAREIMKLWQHGGMRFEPLYPNCEYSALASYLIEQSRKQPKSGEICSKKRWSCSRNLTKPQEKVEEVNAKTWRSEPKPLKGYYIDKSSIEEGVSPVSGQPYQFYRMIKLKPNTRRNM